MTPKSDGCIDLCAGMVEAPPVPPYKWVDDEDGGGGRGWYRCPRCLKSWWTSWGA